MADSTHCAWPRSNCALPRARARQSPSSSSTANASRTSIGSRIEQPGNAAAIAALGAPSWNWKHYLPFVQLALDYGLPIIAVNLSRTDAMRVSTDGWTAVFEPSDRAALALDAWRRTSSPDTNVQSRAATATCCQRMPWHRWHARRSPATS